MSPLVRLPRILVQCSCTFHQLLVTEQAHSPRIINHAIQKEISALWDTAVVEHAAVGATIWDSYVYRLDAVAPALDGGLHLTISPSIRYREILTSRHYREWYHRNDLHLICHMCTIAILITRDQYYILGRKRNPLHPHQVGTVGGTLTRDEGTISKGTDIRAAVYQEIFEETGIPPTAAVSERVRGILLGSSMSCALVTTISLNITSDAIRELFISRPDQDEFSELLYLQKDACMQTLRSGPSWQPLIEELLADTSI